jgi:hypothetical protein
VSVFLTDLCCLFFMSYVSSIATDIAVIYVKPRLRDASWLERYMHRGCARRRSQQVKSQHASKLHLSTFPYLLETSARASSLFDSREPTCVCKRGFIMDSGAYCYHQSRRHGQYALPKRQSTSTRLSGAIPQKADIILTAVRT